MFPGITQKTLGRLKKEDAAVVVQHIELVKAASRKKDDVLKGKFEELGQYVRNPQGEVRQLAQLIKKAEKHASIGLLATLLGIEVDVRELINSISEELILIKKFEKAKGTKMKQVAKEIEREILVAMVIEHQVNLLYDIQKLCLSAIKATQSGADKKFAKEIAKKCANINNIAHFIGRVIFDEEVPNLALVYNILELEEWDEIEKTIMEIKLKFFEYRPNLL